jgi:tetratricopeptide (TPR) repeat protein
MLASYEDEEEFEDALESYRAQRYGESGRRLRAFVKKFQLHIDSYHHLGNIEWHRRKIDRARKYYETGYRIGLLAIPEDFKGQLPWGIIENRPFLRATQGFGLALLRKKRTIEACEAFESLLRLNPNDNQGVRFLLVDIYLNERAIPKARAVLAAHQPDGMNIYSMALLEALEGRRREALRWLCRAVSYNPWVPDMIVGDEEFPNAEAPEYVTVGSQTEAEEYLRKLARLWRRGEPARFLHGVLEAGPFRSRLDRVLQAHRELDDLPVGEKRSAVVQEMFSIFDEQAVPQILAECRGLLGN